MRQTVRSFAGKDRILSTYAIGIRPLPSTCGNPKRDEEREKTSQLLSLPIPISVPALVPQPYPPDLHPPALQPVTTQPIRTQEHILQDTLEGDDPVEGTFNPSREVQIIIQPFGEARKSRLKYAAFCEFISDALNPDTLMSAGAQQEAFLYLTIQETLESNAVSCVPSDMSLNCRIIYCLIETL